MVLRRVTLVPLFLLVLAGCGHTAGPGKPATTAPVSTAPVSTAPVSAAPAAKPSVPHPSTAAAEQLAGTQHAFLTSADTAKRTITFNLVEWFEGKAAADACKADGEPPAENDWCTGWYIRDKNKKLRTYPVAAGAHLRILDTGTDLVAADLKKFRAALLDSRHVFAFTVKAGQITKADEIFTP
jgi:hypothetical protein